ncbi:MAG: 1,4-dihydroxy-2-naphthoate octaprenyltransferase [Lautropia sp.]|nr:1,4-dihydroxy-2-naphthoate octaprenyltransferase [Lautropia sp.]
MMTSLSSRFPSPRAWLVGVRPPTLGLSLVPVLLGTALAVFQGAAFRPGAFLVACLCVLLIQAGTNLFNDVGDGVRGADGPERLGPVRLIGSGQASVRQVRNAAVLCFVLALLGGLWLASHHGPAITVIGICSLLAGWLYSGGPKPLSHTPWGESCVLLFFGIIAVAGSHYLQSGQWSMSAMLFGLVPGCYAAAVLLVNNTRDLVSDMRAGRRTLAAVLGESGAHRLYALLLLLPFGLLLVLSMVFKLPGLILAPLLALPAAGVLIFFFHVRQGRALNVQLKQTALLQAVLAILILMALLL